VAASIPRSTRANVAAGCFERVNALSANPGAGLTAQPLASLHIRGAANSLEPDGDRARNERERQLQQAHYRRHDWNSKDEGILGEMARRREDIERLTELEELFADLWQVPRFAAGWRHEHRPAIDVFRTADPPELTIVVEIAGADPGSIQLLLDGRRLLIAGQRPRARVRGQFDRSEIEYGRFRRELLLNDDVDVGSARANYERGMLTIVLPITPGAQAPQTVTIEIRRST
jgi:HSP20 family protein